MTFASQREGMVSLGLCALCLVVIAGCIATDRIEFNSDLFPPSIVSAPDAENPLNRIAQLNIDDPPPGETEEFLLETIVREPNLEEGLQFRVFFDSPPSPGAPEFVIVEGELGPSGFLERTLDIAIPFTQFEPGACHRIELVVVGEFASGLEHREPVIPGNFDQVTWWVEVSSNDVPPPSGGCQ